MKHFADLSIKIKIALISVIAIIGFVVILGYNYAVTTSNKIRLNNIKNIHYPTLQYTDANTVRLDKIKGLLNMAATSGESDLLEEPDELARLIKQDFVRISEINQDLGNVVSELSAKFSNYYQVAREVSSNIIAGASPDEIDQKITDMGNRLELFTVALKEFSNNAYHQFTSTIELADSASSKALNISIIIFAIVLAVFILASVIITKMITTNISKVVTIINDTANGDLTNHLINNSKDEIGKIAVALNSMIKKISGIVLEMKSTSDRMGSSTEQLWSISNQITDGSEEQLARASQAATASQQMSATVIKVAKNASGAADAAKVANNAASRGGDIVKKTIDSMNGIAETTKVSSGVIACLGDRSNEIGNIIGVIDDIADQTNLLALNAAIEAARAGEQGRGFAVVADEVRKLAERTTKATKEIGSMINAIQDDTGKALSSMEAEVKVVEEGVSLACEAGSAIETIIEQVDTVTSMIEQIATAADEQSTAADQISGDVEMVADIARDSSTNTQQITGVSEDIARLASDLQQIVAMFKVVQG